MKALTQGEYLTLYEDFESFGFPVTLYLKPWRMYLFDEVFLFFSPLYKHLVACSLKVLVLGQPGEEASLELILRVVADVGLVVCEQIFKFFLVLTFVI